ncbi:MAG: ATP-dependent protease subunit HslV [bacterium]|nr:ATP-dependent protease subunit HslV [bacterium]
MLQATTIVCVRRGDAVAIAGDGQVTLQNTIMKNTAKKVRSMRDGKVLGGFAGSASDGMTLFEKFENKLDGFGDNVRRAAVELAREWRTDKYLRKLEAMMIVADKKNMLLLSGNGDVLEPDCGVAAIGSGSGFATAAARALLDNTDLDAETVARKAIEIAAEICIYTNNNITVLTIAE